MRRSAKLNPDDWQYQRTEEELVLKSFELYLQETLDTLNQEARQLYRQ